jgi:hypothetical protein
MRNAEQQAQPPRFGLAALPGALRAYAQRLRTSKDRTCMPLASMLRQLDATFSSRADPMLSETGAVSMRNRVRAALERVEHGSRDAY